MTAAKTENNGETLNLDALANEIKARIAETTKMQTKIDKIIRARRNRIAGRWLIAIGLFCVAIIVVQL